MSATKIIKVVVADDHVLLTAGIVAQLEAATDIEICEIVRDGRAAINACLQHQPHIILLDIGLLGMSGIEAAQSIRRAVPSTKIITITGTEGPYEIAQMIDLGSVACIYKNMEVDLVHTIRAVMGGYILLPDFMFDLYRTKPVASHAPRVENKTSQEFTDQEQIILRELVRGYTNKEIAQHLGIKVSTVKAHMGNIFRKLNVQTRTEVVSLVTMQNLINREVDEGLS